MIKFLIDKAAEFVDGLIKAAEAAKASKTAPYAKEHESSFTGLSAEQKQEYLKMSFQRTAEDFTFPAELADPGQKAVQDSAAVQSIKQMRMNGLSGTGQDKIYEFYGKHGFIGWQLCAVIAQNWAVQNACSIPAEDAARPGWENRFAEGTAAETESGTDAADIPAKVKELALQKYGLMQALIRHARNMKIFGVSYLLPVFDTDYDYSKPYNADGIQPGSFKGFKVIDPYWAMPQWGRQSMSNPASMAFYEPAYYALPGGIKIHATQILKAVNAEVPDILKPSYYFGGIPLTQMIYERVYAAEKVANEAPLMALTKRTSVLYTNLDDVLENPDVAARNLATITRFRDNQGIMLQDLEARYEQHDISLADFDALISTQYQLVAAVAKMPAEKLFKTPISGLGQTGAYAEHDYKQELQSLQERVYMPVVNRANEIIMRSDIGSDAAIAAAFCPVDMPTEREKAEMQELKARINTSYLNSGVITPEEARDALRQDKDSGYAGLTDEMPEDYGAEAENDPPEGNSGNGGGQGQPGGNPQSGQDYVPPDELEGFRNMNGANVPLREGQSKETSMQEFIDEKEAERKAEKEKKEESKTESSAGKTNISNANEKKTLGKITARGQELDYYYKADDADFFKKLKHTPTTAISLIGSSEEAVNSLKKISGKDLSNDETGIVVQINAKQRNKMISNVAIKKSIDNGFSRNEHLSVLTHIKELFKHAILRLERGEGKGVEDIVSIRRFIVPVQFGAGEKTKKAYAKITVKEYRGMQGKRLYTVELHSLKQVEEKAGLDKK
ncbi:MAG: DUF1073 domain-containing protein [Elusimicrobiales bacterium]|nr:DUF1073 domain-containing protein [Elusimicrobiales bacterium]